METPPPQRAITEATPIRLQPATLAILLGFAITTSVGGAIWCTNMASGQSRLQDWSRSIDQRLDRIEHLVTDAAWTQAHPFKVIP